MATKVYIFEKENVTYFHPFFCAQKCSCSFILMMASFLIAAPISSNGNQLNQLPFAQQTLAFPSTCNERLSQLVGDIFIGNEMIPQVLDLPPDYPLELTYR